MPSSFQSQLRIPLLGQYKLRNAHQRLYVHLLSNQNHLRWRDRCLASKELIALPLDWRPISAAEDVIGSESGHERLA